MAEGKKSVSVYILVALIGLVGSIGAALIANWQNIAGSGGPRERDLTFQEARVEAERLTAAWIEAWRTENVDRLTELSRPPFFLDQTVLISKPEIRSRYQQAADQSSGRPEPSFRVDSIESGTIAEYRSRGLITEGDRLLSRMRLTDEDIVVIVISRGEGIGFYFRRLPSRVEMAGFWD